MMLKDGYCLRADGVIEINSDVVYPALMSELAITESQLTQHWLEVIYQCAKLDAIHLAKMNNADKRAEGVPLQIYIQPGRIKERWQLKRYPEGHGVHQALRPGVAQSEGAARRHYRRLRGHLPQ